MIMAKREWKICC